ncbi:uncharacterized protein DUF4399 [Paraburkholderia sp. BL23I1N1]|uniref:DUF4399 domain-containing protein n=1 Tax=Paraburkholderia sp. BL23I1N1 TaxID=1938802 RepID=UPI000E72065F|nr:uncharacterized protein DUF4399 [Paraburkholderia sp. BL23I1N1]
MRRTLTPGVLAIRHGPKPMLAAFRTVWYASLFLLLGIASLPDAALAEQTPSPPGAEEYIIWPSDGAVIHGGKLWVRMGLRNMGVCPKGVAVPNTGHHHLLIDTDLPPLDQEIPSDRNHLHFGAGETDARIELPPGKHTLQLILGDHNHVPHVPPVYSKKITITVLKD